MLQIHGYIEFFGSIETHENRKRKRLIPSRNGDDNGQNHPHMAEVNIRKLSGGWQWVAVHGCMGNVLAMVPRQSVIQSQLDETIAAKHLQDHPGYHESDSIGRPDSAAKNR